MQAPGVGPPLPPFAGMLTVPGAHGGGEDMQPRELHTETFRVRACAAANAPATPRTLIGRARPARFARRAERCAAVCACAQVPWTNRRRRRRAAAARDARIARDAGAGSAQRSRAPFRNRAPPPAAPPRAQVESKTFFFDLKANAHGM